MNHTRIRNSPARERCLTVVGWVGLCSLGQFNKLPPEDIIQTKLSGDFLGDIYSVRTVCIDVDLLENDNVGLCITQEINNRWQLEPAVDIPIDDSKETPWP